MDIKHQSGGLSRRGGGGGRGGGYVVYSTFFKSECYANCLFYLDDSLVASDLEITARLRRALVLGVLRDHAAVVDLIPTTMLHLHLTVITRDTLLGISICFLVYFFFYYFFLVAFCTFPLSLLLMRTERKEKKKKNLPSPWIQLSLLGFVAFSLLSWEAEFSLRPTSFYVACTAVGDLSLYPTSPNNALTRWDGFFFLRWRHQRWANKTGIFFVFLSFFFYLNQQLFGWRPCLLCQFSQEDTAAMLQPVTATPRLTLITLPPTGGVASKRRQTFDGDYYKSVWPPPGTGKKKSPFFFLLHAGRWKWGRSVLNAENAFSTKKKNNFDVGSDLELFFVFFFPELYLRLLNVFLYA